MHDAAQGLQVQMSKARVVDFQDVENIVPEPRARRKAHHCTEQFANLSNSPLELRVGF